MLIPNKHNGYSADGRRLYPMDFGGGGQQQTSGGTAIQELPEWARPYAKGTLEKGAALTERPYQAYDAPRIAGFSPMQLQAQQAAAGMAPSAATGAGINVAAEAAMRGLGTQYQPGQFQNQFQAPAEYQAGRFGARPVRAMGLEQYQMGPAERVGTESFRQPGAAEAYMSPYMQNVVDIQQREARRASDIAGQGQQAEAVGRGAFGGSRDALMRAERQRNLATQLGDIQATGQQAAFQNAQQQFNAEQNARLAAQQANQQAGLTTGLQNLNALLGVQSLGAQQGLQAQQLNQQAALEAQRLGEQSRQFGAGQGLQAASLGAQYGQAAQQLGEQSRQYGAGLGIQGLNTALQGAGQLGTLGGQQFQQGMDINKLQSAYGGQQQALRQQGLTQAYEDFQNEQNYPYKQLGFMSDLIRGLPLGQQTTRSMYEPGPNTAQQIGALGMGAYGLSKFMAEGGMAYADGGEVEGYKLGGGVDSRDNVEEIVSNLRTDQDLQKALMAARARGDTDQAEAVEAEMALRASLRRGIAGGITNQMADRMAGGGVVAFAGKGSSLTDSGEDDTDTSGRYVESKGDPYVYGEFGKFGLEQLKRLKDLKAYESLTPEQRDAMDKANYARIMKFAGEDPYAPMAERLKGYEADRLANLEKEKGAAAFQAIPAILEGRGIRGIAGGVGKLGSGLAAAARADAAEKRAIGREQFALSDAQRKERMATGREALGTTKDMEANRLAAHAAERADIAAGITGAGKFAQAFRPIGGGRGGAGGAGKLPQVDRETAALQDKLIDLKATPNANPAQVKALEDKIDARMKIIAATKTSERGPEALAMEAEKLAAMTDKDIDAQVRAAKFMDSEWQQAMGNSKAQAAAETRIRNELLTRRNNAKLSVNRNSSTVTPIKLD